jgi:hypothetical protein
MKNLAYETIFGKKYTHEEALKSMIIGSLSDIIREENNVSEKDFQKYDQVITQSNDIITHDVLETISDMYNSGKRVQYIAEYIYDTHINTNQLVTECVILNFDKFTNAKLL